MRPRQLSTSKTCKHAQWPMMRSIPSSCRNPETAWRNVSALTCRQAASGQWWENNRVGGRLQNILTGVFIKPHNQRGNKMGKPLRAVIVIDFEAQTFRDASELDAAIQQKAQNLCEGLVDPSNNSSDDLCILNHQAGVLLSERRGPTGSIHDIVFRGTRGPNSLKEADLENKLKNNLNLVK